jgi:uncharacterized protein YdaU (DUF1376 family)
VNFVKLYIGDYLRDTGTLTLAQHGAYALMLLEHYATEKPLPQGRELHRLLRADSKAERDAIDFVAAKFWTLTEGGMTNSRALKEIERASNQRAINQEIGKRGGRPKRTDQTTESETESVTESQADRNPNQTPDTINTKTTPGPLAGASPPLPKSTKPAAIERPEGVAAQVWSDWLALRRAKKAPVTATVVEGAHGEAAKAGMSLDAFLRVWCARGSQGLQAEWLRPEERQAARPPPVRPLTPGEARMLEACPSVVSESVRQRAAATNPKPLEFVDVVEPTPAARRLG